MPSSVIVLVRPLPFIYTYWGKVGEVFGEAQTARTVRDANLETRTARARLPVRRKPHWRKIDQGSHIGYYKGKRAGTWIARYFLGRGKYAETKLGTADDVQDADGVAVLSFTQGQAKAREWFAECARATAGHGPAKPYTVGDAIAHYLEWYAAERTTHRAHNLRDIRYRVDAFILPHFGNVEVSKLSAQRIRNWLYELASTPPRARSGAGKPVRYRDTSDDPEAERKRRHSANKVLTILKAALNHSWHERRVPSDDAWRRVRPFRGVDAARIRYLSKAECVRLVNACEPHFRHLVQAALLTGCRYGELAALKVADFNEDAGTVFVHESKSGKSRHVVLTDEGCAFFEAATAGRPGDEIIFLREDGRSWGKSHQNRPLAEACQRAGIKPPASFHIFRHTYGSHFVMNGVPLIVVAENLGHADTRMTEKHYAHLAPSYVANAIRAAAPKMGIGVASNVTTLRPHGA